MKIKIRKVIEEERTAIDEITKKPYKYTYSYENGYVEELDVDLFNKEEVNAFSFDKGLRLIGINKNLYRLTMKSWKEVKKELYKYNLANRFDLSKGV